MTNEQSKQKPIIPQYVTDSHYLLSIHVPNSEQSFNINLDTLPLDQLDISLLYPKIKNLYGKE